MRPYVVFFDDSGSPDPDQGDYYVLGAVVIPFSSLKTISQNWLEIIETTLKIKNPPALGIEAKWAELNQYRKEASRGNINYDRFKVLVDLGVSAKTIGELMVALVQFIAEQDVTLAAVVIDKKENWRRFKQFEYSLFLQLSPYKKQDKAVKKQVDGLREKLREDVLKKAFEWLVLQRIQYLMEDFGDAECLVIGDEGYAQQTWYQRQNFVQFGSAGLARYTHAPNIVGTVAFSSSLYSPGLQIADWVANAVHLWARKNPGMLQRIIHRFRGAPDKIKGHGLVLVPAPTLFPELPQSRG